MSDLKQQLPSWVIDLYDPAELSPHRLVIRESKNRYLVRTLDFTAVNLLEKDYSPYTDVPYTEETVHEGSILELMEEAKQSGWKIIYPREYQKQHEPDENKFPLLGSSSEPTKYSSIVWAYQSFLEAYKAYKQNPNDVALAYTFINQHPMFWRFDDSKLSISHRNLQVENGCETIWVTATHDDNGKPLIMLEAGGATEDRKSLYHDLNLDVYKPSFDEAYIELAALIHKHYDEHGVLRDGRKEPNENLFNDLDD